MLHYTNSRINSSHTENNNENNYKFTNNKRIFTNNDKITLKDEETTKYFIEINDKFTCYKIGTDVELTRKSKKIGKNPKCICRRHYFGPDCGIPAAVWDDNNRSRKFYKSLKRRKIARRIINGFPVLKEFDVIESRINDLNGAVDVFLIGESSYSAHGDKKPTYILDKLHETDFLNEFQDTILHEFVDEFPSIAVNDSGLADRYLRIFLGKRGIPRVLNKKDDDLFILNDADEIPTREVIMFLKLYDGYTEPITFVYQWSVYGFFWKSKTVNLLFNDERPTKVSTSCSLRLLRDVFGNNPFWIRKFSQNMLNKIIETRLQEYALEYPNTVLPWTVGSVGRYAGWHCSWCLP